MTEIKEPKDLKVKIGTKEQVLWEKVAKEAKVLIEQSEDNLTIQKSILVMADFKIGNEKAKDLNT